MLTRRLLLTTVAPGAALVALTGCTATQEAQFAANWSNFVDKVNAIVSKGCGLLPAFVASANTVEALATALYPSVGAAIAAGAAGIQAVAGSLCSTTPAAPPAALARKLRRAATSGVPTFVGNVTVNGKVVPVTGYGLR